MLTPSQSESVVRLMTPDEQQFLKALGSRIATLRKEQGVSQQAMADHLGVAQQTYAHYEVGRIRMPIATLPVVAQFFGVSVDELLGRKNGAGKRGPAPRLQQQIERLSRLPKAKQKFVMEMLEGVLGQAGR
jgi:transcriptional regulator with XRE-family HTH domain